MPTRARPADAAGPSRAADAPPLWRWLRWAVLGLFAALGVLIMAVHEPWRDEAQAWLLARDAGLWDLISNLAGHEASPVLWHLLNVPLARLELPYASQRVLNLAFALGAAALILWRAPVPPWLRVWFVLSHLFVYVHGGVARSYAMGTFLLVLLLALRPGRDARPLRYGGVAALLANANVFGLLLAAALGLEWLADAVRRRAGWAVRAGLALAVLGGVLAVWQILPPADNWRGDGLRPASPPGGPPWERAGNILIETTYWPRSLLAGTGLGGVLDPLAAAALWAALLWPLRRAPRALLVFGAFALGLFYIGLFERPLGLRHSGHLILAYLAALWIAGPAPWRGGRAPTAAALAAAVVFAGSTADLARAVARDAALPFSAGPGMAAHLRETGLWRREIVAYPAPHASAVLPYFPGKRFWYPRTGGPGSYVVWRAGATRDLGAGDVMRAADAMGAPHDALILLAAPAEAPGLRLLHAAPGLRSRLYLYERAAPAPP